MKDTYLVQRLTQAWKVKEDNPLSQLQNAFSFGGGLVNGGFSKEAMELLKPLFSFDYMGSAEFEFGAVPESIFHIVENKKNYISFETEIKYSYKGWKDKETAKGKRPVFVICKKADQEEVLNRLKLFAKGSYHNTKELINFDSSLAEADYSKKIIGWLELDNHFAFFKDVEVGKQFANLVLKENE